MILTKKLIRFINILVVIGACLVITNACSKDKDIPLTTLTDIDGNVYNIVVIGNQTWTAENLRTTKYNDGTAIPLVSDKSEWANLTTGAYCWYNNDEETYGAAYGAMYNWFTIESSKLCPDGWHVPSNSEILTLIKYVRSNGYNGIEGKGLKSEDIWVIGENGTNEFGFAAVPNGLRSYRNGEYYDAGEYSYTWTSSETDITSANILKLRNESDQIENSLPTVKSCGLSIRCIKDK